MFYLLEVNCEQGCCNYAPPTAKAHILIHPTIPNLIDQNPVQAPPNWNPMVAPMIAFVNTKPFMYQPANFHARYGINQEGGMPNIGVQMGQPMQMQGVQPNFNNTEMAMMGNTPNQVNMMGNPNQMSQVNQMNNPNQMSNPNQMNNHNQMNTMGNNPNQYGY